MACHVAVLLFPVSPGMGGPVGPIIGEGGFLVAMGDLYLPPPELEPPRSKHAAVWRRVTAPRGEVWVVADAAGLVCLRWEFAFQFLYKTQ